MNLAEFFVTCAFAFLFGVLVTGYWITGTAETIYLRTKSRVKRLLRRQKRSENDTVLTADDFARKVEEHQRASREYWEQADREAKKFFGGTPFGGDKS